MKTIIVAMDFSKGALNALNYAIDVALMTESEVIMLWVDSSIEGKFPGEKNEIRNDAKIELKTIIDTRTSEHEALQISYKLKKGKVYQEIASLAKNVDADLVIVGTHGIGGFEEFWVGSNTFKIISYSPCPVISVRTDFVLGGSIKKIILPIDDSFETTKKVPMAAKIAQAFKADILILRIYESELPSIRKKTDVYVKDTIRFLKTKSINVEEAPCSSNNISKSIVKYAEKAEADLIVIMTDQDKATSDIIMGMNSQQIINRSSIPILSVKPDKMEF
jgi:nucleotide-binding universal stress UspA family protein